MDTMSRVVLQPALQFIAAKRKQTTYNVFQLDAIQNEIVATEKRRQQLQSDLLEASVKRLALMQEAANLKAGPHLATELENTCLQLSLNHEKSR